MLVEEFLFKYPGPYQFLIPLAKYFPGKDIFSSISKGNIRGERMFEIVFCPFDGRADMHNQI